MGKWPRWFVAEVVRSATLLCELRIEAVVTPEVLHDTAMDARDEGRPEIHGQPVGLTMFDSGTEAFFGCHGMKISDIIIAEKA